MQDKTLIGIVLKPQGLMGEVKIEPFTDDPARFFSLKQVFIEGGGNTPHKILHCRETHGNVFLVLQNIDNRDKAEEIRGKKLFINKSERVKLPEGHYFLADIIGAEVFLGENQRFGKLIEVLQHGAADVFRVKTDKGMCMFPSLKNVVQKVDAQKIILDEAELSKVIVYED